MSYVYLSLGVCTFWRLISVHAYKHNSEFSEFYAFGPVRLWVVPRLALQGIDHIFIW